MRPLAIMKRRRILGLSSAQQAVDWKLKSRSLGDSRCSDCRSEPTASQSAVREGRAHHSLLPLSLALLLPNPLSVMSNTLDTLIAESPVPSPNGNGVGESLPAASSPIAPEDETLHSTAASIRAAGTTYSGLSKSTKTYEAVATYRSQFRTQNIPAEYSVYRHLGMITAWGSAAALLSGYFAGGPFAIVKSPLLLLMVFLAFALANYFEYYAHRYKLHNPLVHTRHSHTHHR